MKKWLICLLILALSLSPALAEEKAAVPGLSRQGLALGEGWVYYPQVEGLADEAVLQSVNDAVLQALDAQGLLTRLALTMQSPTPLRADYTAFLTEDVLSVVMEVSGPVMDERATHQWRTVNIDLRTGEVIALNDLFTDAQAARAFLCDELEWELAPALSAHLRNNQLVPLPEGFGLSDSGLTLYYDIDQLCTLGDKAGTVHIRWSRLRPWLDTSAQGLPRRVGALRMITLDESSAACIRQTVAEGSLPGIPAALGEGVQACIDRYGLLIDPDLYEDGRLFQLQDGAFRDAYLLSDRISSTWTESVVQGIRSDRLDLYGLCTGETRREAWLSLLGEPDATVTLDAERADSYRMAPGTSDYYQLGDVRLRLHADEEGVLASVILTR